MKFQDLEHKLIHFVGIGGIGMSALAFFLKDLGFNVTGSDKIESYMVEKLRAKGIDIFIGHAKENVENATCIVVSTAIAETNEEFQYAKNNDIPVFHRSEVLSALMNGFGQAKKITSVGVTGTHGKTTTSGMISTVFEDAGRDPSFALGGKIVSLGNVNSKFGNGNHFISEVDESDNTIHHYSPDILVITNLEADHLDHYKKGFSEILESFERFLKTLTGKIIINTDCEGNRKLMRSSRHCIPQDDVITYSLENEADYRAKNIQQKELVSTADIYKKDEKIGTIELQTPGEHNVSNALASIAVAIECGLSFESIKTGLAGFKGMGRRFQAVGVENNIKIIDDYAHHPTEVAATLKAVKQLNHNRIIAVFEPHRYTRLKSFWDEFLKSFKDADFVYVADVFPAGEEAIKNISSKEFSIELENSSYVEGTMEEAAKKIAPELQTGDVVLTMGAGYITNIGNHLLEEIKKCPAI